MRIKGLISYNYLTNKKDRQMKKELINIIIDNETVKDYWTNDLIYNGENLFDVYVKNLDDFSNKLEIGKEIEMDDYSNSENNGNVSLLCGQEVYLGYIVSADVFISAFDVWDDNKWGSDEIGSGHIYFKIVDGKVQYIKTEIAWGDHFYDTRGWLNRLREEFKDLVDIRLG